MSKAIQMLFDEHDVIAGAIAAARQAKSYLGKNEKGYETTIRDLLNFFRHYADNFHHQKEELILFPEMKRKNEQLADGVLKEMTEHHEEFREMLKNIEQFLNEKQFARAQQQIEVYSESLLNHIAVENEEIFQMADTLFTLDELETMFGRFEDCDIETGSLEKEELAGMAEEIRKNLHYAA